MCRNPRIPACGFALPAAIFLLVALWILGAVIAALSGVQHSGAALDVQGVQAYQAARAGIEWAAYQALDPERTLNPTTCDPVVMAECPGPGGVATLGTLGGSLAAYTVTVQCSRDASDATEGHRTIRVYSVTATACNEPSAGACPGVSPSPAYVERRISATLSKCKDRTATAPRCSC